jgi:microcystin-dependent protein
MAITQVQPEMLSSVGSTSLVPTGVILPFGGLVVPAGWMLCSGGTQLRASQPNLFNAITAAAVVTITIANPAVVSWTNHGLVAGNVISFETTNTLPTGISVGTNYYVISAGLTTNAFEFSTSVGGSAVVTTGSQSGVQTARHNPHGCGNGTTTFGIPDGRGVGFAGEDAMGGTARGILGSGNSTGIAGPAVIGTFGGEQSHVLATGELPAHSHGISDPTHSHGASGAGLVGNNLVNGTTRAVGTGDGTNSGFFQNVTVSVSSAGTGISTTNTGSGSSHNVMQPTLVVKYIIKL